MKQIELTDQEKEVIKKQLNGDITQFSATDEERVLLTSVIHKAEALLEELDAYDELDGDMIKWFWNKYQEQK